MDLHVLDDNPFNLLPVPQTRIERVLAERAAGLGVEVRRGHELTVWVLTLGQPCDQCICLW